MKIKKIKELTIKECRIICSKYKCIDCPLFQEERRINGMQKLCRLHLLELEQTVYEARFDNGTPYLEREVEINESNNDQH